MHYHPNRARQRFDGGEGRRRYRFGHYLPESAGLAFMLLVIHGLPQWSGHVVPVAISLYGMALICFFLGFFIKLRDYRSVANVSTSRIASAPQGFAEFRCWIREDSLTMFAPKVRARCVWYHHIVQEDRGEESDKPDWHVVSEEVCPRPIWLEDGSGQSMLAHPAFLIQSAFTCLTLEERFDGFRRPLLHLVHILEAGEDVLANGLFASFESPNMALARHLVGPKGLDRAEDCLREVLSLMEVEPADLSGERRWHALGYSQHHKMGVLHSGSEHHYLRAMRNGLWLSGGLLVTAFGLMSMTASM